MVRLLSESATIDAENWRQLTSADWDGPVVMVNLLRFKKVAQYNNGRSDDISGQNAYDIYATSMTKLIKENGGKLIYAGDPIAVLIGESENWDRLAIVQYPDAATFIRLVSSELYNKIAAHRMAGLESQALIATRPMSAKSTQ